MSQIMVSPDAIYELGDDGVARRLSDPFVSFEPLKDHLWRHPDGRLELVTEEEFERRLQRENRGATLKFLTALALIAFGLAGTWTAILYLAWRALP